MLQKVCTVHNKTKRAGDGKTITNKEKHKKSLYSLGTHDAFSKIRQKRFCTLEEIVKDLEETEETKMKVSIKVVLFFVIVFVLSASFHR